MAQFGGDINGGSASPDIEANLAENLAGIFSTKPLGKYFTGARCIIRINGALAGFAFGIQWKIETSQDEINTIDDYFPYEYAPKRCRVEGTISCFHIPGRGATAEDIQPTALSFLFQRYITIEVRDSQTDNLLFMTTKAVITSRVEDVRAENLATASLSFKAIGWLDEKKPDFPGGHDAAQGEGGLVGKAIGALKSFAG
jgi:hypothetical protein